MSSTTYYQYKDVKVNIAHRLFNMEGWTVYGYHADNSDLMTDYFDPANWGGIATKNGYTLVVDHNQPANEYRYTYTEQAETAPDILDKIEKLSRMTQANGASEQEEATAKAAIIKLQEKQTAGTVKKEVYTPGHMANPPRCNWHIEKDGIILDKGTGLLKFASVPDITNSYELEKWQEFNNLSREEWINTTKIEYMHRWNENDEQAGKSAESAYNTAVKKYQLLEQFNILLNRFNTVAGGMVGNSGENGYTYAVKKITKYKKVYKFVPSSTGSFKVGQCFRLKTSFNYGCFSGFVYRFVAYGEDCVKGERVSLKSNKNLTGLATPSNRFGYYSIDNASSDHGRDKEKFLNWISSGAIEWGEVVEVSEPYEVEKYVKVDANGNECKKTRSPQEATTKAEETPTSINYIVTADTDTRDGSPLWVVTLSDHVSREEFDKIREEIKKLGGYYSRFKKGFIFREDPTEKLNGGQSSEDVITEETTTEEPAAEVPPVTLEETPEDIPTEEPAETKKSSYGYTGESSDFFTPEELQKLIAGEQIKKGEGYKRHIYFTLNYNDLIKFVYNAHTGDADELRPKTRPDYTGFIYAGKYYTDYAAIIQELRDDINTELLKTIPTEEAAEANAVSLNNYQAETADRLRSDTYEREAQRHFVDDTTPELYLYSCCDGLAETDALHYILNAEEVVKGFADAYKSSHQDDILYKYIKYNRTVEALNAIKKDKTHTAHALKQIKQATADDKQKTFKILLANGHTVKIEAVAVRLLPYSGSIYSSYVVCCDRQYLNKNEYGRPNDITPDDIITISHGSKLLYKKTA